MAKSWPGCGRNGSLKEQRINSRRALGDPLELGDGLDESEDSSPVQACDFRTGGGGGGLCRVYSQRKEKELVVGKGQSSRFAVFRRTYLKMGEDAEWVQPLKLGGHICEAD